MAIANINWSFNPQTSVGPIVSCTFSVTVTRDGVTLPAFSVTTNSSGSASGTYRDTSASSTITHQYRFTPQLAGCAANCTASPVAVNWNCTGTSTPVDPGVTPATGCPDVSNSFIPCGGTAATRQVAVGGSVSLQQSFSGTTSVVVSGSVPGLSASTTSTSGALNGSPTTAGTYSVKFIGAKGGCADCAVTYPLIVGAGASSTQRITVIKAESAFTPANLTSYNASRQRIQVTVIGPPGQTFNIVCSGAPRNAATPIFTIPPSGTFEWSTPTGHAVDNIENWNVNPMVDTAVSPASTAITLSNPAATVILGNTAISLAVPKTATGFSIVVTAPVGAVGVPFAMGYGGASFGNSSPECNPATYGVLDENSNTALGNTPGANVYTIGPYAVDSGYSAAFTLGGDYFPNYEHIILFPRCIKVVFP